MRLILLILIVSSVFGAGVVDILFADIIPLRPYSGVFRTILIASPPSILPIQSVAMATNQIVTGLFQLVLVWLIVVSISLLVSHPIPFLIGQHGKSQVSHTRYGKSKLTKRIIARKILKQIQRTA